MKVGKKGKKQLHFTQEPAKEVISRKLNNVSWKNLIILMISNGCQLLVIWIMLLLRSVTEYRFSIDDYISNLLAFVIVACATNLSDAFGKDSSKFKETLTYFTIGLLIFVICFASILYCLSVICDWGIDIKIKKDVICAISIIFTLIVILVSLLHAVKR